MVVFKGGVGDITQFQSSFHPTTLPFAEDEFCLQKPSCHFSMLKPNPDKLRGCNGNIKAMIQRFYDPVSGSVLIGSGAQQTSPSKRKPES